MEKLLNKKFDRRKFLKVAGTGLTLFTLESMLTKINAEDILPKESTTQKRYAMVIDLRKCIGCDACTVACKQENNIPVGYFRTWVKKVEKGKYDKVRDNYLPTLCNHCENAICNRNCPVKATYKTKEGLTLVDYDRCIGCRYCMVSCPYNVRFAHPYRKTVDKCTFCVHRLKENRLPACVETCVGKARIFGDINDKNSEIFKVISTQPIQVLKAEQNTKPHVFYIALDYETLDAGKNDFDYMKYYRRDIKKELNIDDKKVKSYFRILAGISEADRKYKHQKRLNP